jgi:tripartite motif-containing protein 71
VRRGQLFLFLVLGVLFSSLGFASAECTTSFLRKFGGESSGAGHLLEPRDVAIDSKGNAWVDDYGHDRIQEFNSSGEFVSQFDLPPTAEGIALDGEGNVWVAGFKKIYEYRQNGELIQSFGSEGTGNGQFSTLQDIAVDPSGNVWVVERGSEKFGEAKTRVQKFNSKGEYVSQFGKEGTENGQFKSPEAITTDSEGDILVADTGNNRYEEFNPAGEFVRKVGTKGDENGQFTSPRGIAVDSEGKVWVTDSGNDRIERFSAKGTYLSQFGSYGPNDGQFFEPRGISVSGSNIWVADTKNDRVQELSCL